MNDRKNFFRFVIPSILAFALSGVYAIVDGFFIGQSLGDIGLAATVYHLRHDCHDRRIFDQCFSGCRLCPQAGHGWRGLVHCISYVVCIAYLLLQGVSNGSQPLISKHYGENDMQGAKTIRRLAYETAFAITAVCNLGLCREAVEY